MLEENAKTGPTGEMTLAAFYARRGRLPQAIELLQRFADTAKPEELAFAAVSLASSEKVSPQQLQQVESLLAAAAARKQSTALLTALGVLEIVQGRPEQAEAFYRQVVAMDPNDYHALNNLALLLAVSAANGDAASKKKTDEALTLIDRAIELAGAVRLARFAGRNQDRPRRTATSLGRP